MKGGLGYCLPLPVYFGPHIFVEPLQCVVCYLKQYCYANGSSTTYQSEINL